MKAVVAAFNQEKALVGAFSVITNLRMELFEALVGRYLPSLATVPLSWLEELLSELAVSGRTAWIVGHIPPGKFERFYQFCGEYKGCDTHGGYWGFHWLR